MGNTDWYQQVLTPPDVVEVRIRLGLVHQADHAQVLVEMFDPMTNVMQAQASVPHMALAEWPSLLEWAVSKANDWIAESVEPF